MHAHRYSKKGKSLYWEICFCGKTRKWISERGGYEFVHTVTYYYPDENRYRTMEKSYHE